MKDISKTLREKLFYRPQFANPKLASFYETLRHRIFPDETSFVSLLSSDNLDEQYEHAARIISRICYESNYPPTRELLSDILSIEHACKTDQIDDTSYIARDHYLHSVYVYMIGIYIFFYNNTFYNFITSHYRYARECSSYENDELCCIKDFISAWKYFSLYHDLGYQVELLTQAKYAKLPLKLKKSVFKYSLDSSWQKYHFCIQNTAKVFARILLVGKIIEDAQKDTTFRDKIHKRINIEHFVEYLEDEKKYVSVDTHDILNYCTFNDLVHLRKVYSHRAMKTIIAAIGIENVVLVATDSMNGRLAFIARSNGKATRVFCRDDYVLTSEIESAPNILFFDDYRDDRITFSYFASSATWSKNNEAILSAMHNSLENIEEKFIRISSDTQLVTYEYEIYDLIIKETALMFGSDKRFHKRLFDIAKAPDTQKEKALSRLKMEILNRLSNKYLDVIRNSVKHLTLQMIDKNYKEVTPTDKTASIEDILSLHVDAITQSIHFLFEDDKQVTQNSLKYELSTTYCTQLDIKNQFWSNIINIYVEIASALIDYHPEYSYDYLKRNKHIDYTAMNKVLNLKLVKHSKTRITTLEDFENEYEYHNGLTDDHGIQSAYCFINEFDMYMHIANSKSLIENGFAYIMFNMSFPSDEFRMRYQTNYEHIISDVAYSIYIHNLYPKYFKDSNLKKFRTDIDAPFTYLALLCDFLQKWNRPHAQHPTTFINRPNTDASDAYDIQIQDGYIYVHENRTSKAQKRLQRNLSSLEDYLNLPNSFICNADSL